MTSDTSVESGARSLATTRPSISFGVKMPTSLSPSITKVPFRRSPINFPASKQVLVGDTLLNLDEPRIVRNVGIEPPNICSIIACIANIWAWLAPLLPLTFFIAPTIASEIVLPLSLSSLAFSNADIVSYKHLAISSRPTTAPLASNTGK